MEKRICSIAADVVIRKLQLVGKRNITVSELSHLWMGEAFYGQRPQYKMSNNDGTETTRSFQGKTGQFPVLELRKQKDKQRILTKP
jgi:hypothetical protein